MYTLKPLYSRNMRPRYLPDTTLAGTEKRSGRGASNKISGPAGNINRDYRAETVNFLNCSDSCASEWR
jgi:dUTPase